MGYPVVIYEYTSTTSNTIISEIYFINLIHIYLSSEDENYDIFLIWKNIVSNFIYSLSSQICYLNASFGNVFKYLFLWICKMHHKEYNYLFKFFSKYSETGIVENWNSGYKILSRKIVDGQSFIWVSFCFQMVHINSYF